MSSLSDIGISLAQTAILRILEDARNAEAKLNRQLTEDGKPTLEPFFYTRDQMAEARAEIEALKAPAAEPRKYHWGNSERVSPTASASAREAHGRERLPGPDPELAVDVISIASRDPAISDRHFRSIGKLTATVFRPQAFGPKIPLAREIAARRWIDAVPPIGFEGERSDAIVERAKRANGVSPADVDGARAAALASGIESGEVIPIDRDKTAKFIVASYDAALREQEEKPK